MRSIKTFYRITLTVILLFATSNLFGAFANAAQRRADEQKFLQTSNDDDITLTLGKPIERSLAGNEAHSYKIVLAANQYLHVVVEQRGIDVVVTLFALDGKKIAEVDSPNGSQGPEPISVVAEVAGSYRLEVRSPEPKAKAGRYEAKIEEIRTATTQDRTRVAAQLAAKQTYAEAAKLESQGSPESLRKAIAKYKESLPFWLSADDRVGSATTTNRIGFVYSLLGEKQKALDFYQQALPLLRAIGNPAREARTLNNIGAVYNTLGEKQKALDFFEQSLTIRRAIGDRAGEAVTLNNIGVVYAKLGDNQKALDFYNQALLLRRATGDRAGEATTLNNIGVVYSSLNEKQKALDSYNQSLLLSRMVGDREGEAATLHNIGSIYDSLSERQKALDFYQQSLLLRRAIGDRAGEVGTLINIGTVYNSLDDNQKALDFYNQSLGLSRAVGDRLGEAATLYGIATVEGNRGNLEESLSQIEAAIVIVESLRTKIASQELRSSYFATVQNYYNLYIDVLMRLHKQHPADGYNAKALQASERARARSLLETLAEASADIRQGVDPVLLERERSIQQLLAGKSERLSRISNDERLKAQKPDAEKEVNELLAQYQDVQAQIRVKSPRYAALTQPVPSDLTEIQGLLDKDTVLLEYALGEERSYLWLVTQQSLKSYELPKRVLIEESANRLLETITIQNNAPVSNNAEYLKQQALVKQTKADFPRAAAELSKTLLGQIAAEIEGRRLLIVGDGVLQYVPFATLPKPVPVNGKMSAGEALTASNEIVSLPSASTLAALRREEGVRPQRKPYTKTVAVFADPVFDADDIRVSSVVKSNKAQSPTTTTLPEAQKPDSNVPPVEPENPMLRSAKEVGMTNRGVLRRLLASKDEAEAIRAVAPTGQTTLLMNFDASRERVMTSNLAEYRIVHFATHGLLNEENPELSGVVLSLVDKQGKPQNGFLRLHEIFNLNLPVEMVVLSACQTGLGKKIKGEGLVGLTRGFMYAGAPRVVASLWAVDDTATKELMRIFYQKMLREGLSPAAALRAAQKEMREHKIERFRLPIHWSGFILQGEWRDIAPNRK